MEEGKKLDFGIYINADDIALQLKNKGCPFDAFEVEVTKKELLKTASESGLINNTFSIERFSDCIRLEHNVLKLNKKQAGKLDDNPGERVAQIVADFLRKKLLSLEKKFSFETVFSHEGKVDFMKQAKDAGYKVYLYYVSTEHPRINNYRVNVVRAGKKGHVVSKEKIYSRYYRSMNLMYQAAALSYQAYFFDNSYDGSNHTMFAHFKVTGEGVKIWDETHKESYPIWFKKYYSAKLAR